MSDVISIKAVAISLPDVSDEKQAQITGTLNKVGMEKIEMPIRYVLPNGELAMLPSQINATVSLDKKEAMGIHMSRLYLSLEKKLSEKALSSHVVAELLNEFIDGHKGLSLSSFIDIDFTLPIKRKALISEQTGWRQYKVGLSGALNPQGIEFITRVEIVYSSTCPCSAALSRQLNAEKMLEKFNHTDSISKQELRQWMLEEESVAATPHAQRSYVDIKVKSDNASDVPSFIELIDAIEGSLKTSVQSAVKRSDEQEFARLNASNLMFCEDSGRRIKQKLNLDSRFKDFWAYIRHEESLHPHNAVSVISKGVENGW